MSYRYLELVQPLYHYVVVDEVQDMTNIQLKLILSSLKISGNFLLCGDANQIVHPNFFSWSKIKTLFYKDKQATRDIYQILSTNYRNSQLVTELSNKLLLIKNARFGSVDRESTYLVNTQSPIKGEVNLLPDSDKFKKELNSKTQQSTRFAVLVMNNQDKAEARKFFKTPLIFSIQEAKGLEYENIILYNFISAYQKEFSEITRGIDDSVFEKVATQILLRSLYLHEAIRVQQAMDGKGFNQLYDRIKQPSIRLQVGDKIIKVNNHAMASFLVQYMLAVQKERIPERTDFSMNDIMEMIEILPESIMPSYRRQRTYINSILANNEVDRDFAYNKRLFRRTGRGCYMVNPQLTLVEDSF